MICGRCKQEHEGKTKTCESCKDYERKYRKNNAERIKKRDREYRKNNAERIREYQQEYRERNADRINEYQQEYYERNVEQKKEYRERNADKNKEYQKEYYTTVHGKFIKIRNSAHRRSINFEITEEFVGDLTNQECFYCGTETTESLRNGIDRLDNTKGYVENNCRSCCGTCNNMKQCLDPLTFVERCSQVSSHNGFDGAVCESWDDIKGYSYADYKNIMNNHKDFQLTKEQYDALRQGVCTYCGRSCSETHTNGIDRVDSTHGYVFDNCVSCCGDCNYAKGAMTKDEFIQKCVKIASKTHTFPDMDRCVKMIVRNRPNNLT